MGRDGGLGLYGGARRCVDGVSVSVAERATVRPSAVSSARVQALAPMGWLMARVVPAARGRYERPRRFRRPWGRDRWAPWVLWVLWVLRVLRFLWVPWGPWALLSPWGLAGLPPQPLPLLP
ncbi:hypothetical protein B1H18_10590 [Streptomyces tsukubensis]|uniref:Uncharacterized protein n=1 Tax=Streptomyces tsukubensis TaxID=83656 RepID=A0A1V4ABS8_9ACTN|nr:hypothetical protein B1H18_10590 [Streptomyces tsukubensis]